MRAAIYIRVSTSNQVNEGESLAAQESRCLAEITHRGWTLHKTYRDEGISAYDRTAHRSGFSEMLQAARAKRFQVLVVSSLSRFGRRVVETLQTIDELSKLNIRILFLDQNLDTSTSLGEFFLTVMAAIAQLESAQLSERIRSVKQYLASEGRPSGGRPPYGYLHLGGERQILEDQAAIVRRIFQDFLAGLSTNRIAGRLNADGIPSQRESIWRGRNIYRMLRNPVYAALYEDSGSLKKAQHESIINPEMWYQAQVRLHDTNQQSRQARQLLTGFGLLRCGYCGSTLNYNLKRSGDRRRAYGYYSCNARAAGRQCERSRLIRVEILNSAAIDLLRQVVEARNTILDQLRQTALLQNDIKIGREQTLYRELEDLRRRYDSLLALLENPNFDVEAVNARAAKLTRRKEEIELNLAAIKAIRDQNRGQDLLKGIKKHLEQLETALNSEDITQIRRAIPAFFTEIRIFRKRAEFTLRGFSLTGQSVLKYPLPSGYAGFLASRTAMGAPGATNTN